MRSGDIVSPTRRKAVVVTAALIAVVLFTAAGLLFLSPPLTLYSSEYAFLVTIIVWWDTVIVYSSRFASLFSHILMDFLNSIFILLDKHEIFPICYCNSPCWLLYVWNYFLPGLSDNDYGFRHLNKLISGTLKEVVSSPPRKLLLSCKPSFSAFFSSAEFCNWGCERIRGPQMHTDFVAGCLVLFVISVGVGQAEFGFFPCRYASSECRWMN